MSLPPVRDIIGQDVYLDEEAFTTAAAQMAALADEFRGLRDRINRSLAELRTGFQTPAGEKFFKACGSDLLQPLDDQIRVIDHVSQNLETAQQSYQSVFQEYRELQTRIHNIE